MCFPGCDHKLDNVVFKFNTDKALLPLTSVNTVSFFFFLIIETSSGLCWSIAEKGFHTVKKSEKR